MKSETEKMQGNYGDPSPVGQRFIDLVAEWRNLHPHQAAMPRPVQDRLWAMAGFITGGLSTVRPEYFHEGDKVMVQGQNSGVGEGEYAVLSVIANRVRVGDGKTKDKVVPYKNLSWVPGGENLE